MTQILPPNTPTYETANHNWTRPDNVWLSHQALNLYTACYTHPTIPPTHADHLPIVKIIDILVERSLPKPSPNFRAINFDDFNTFLKDRLDQDSPARHITSEQQFHTKVNTLTNIIQETINVKVPVRKPSPHSKRWWNADLSALRKKKNQLSYKAHKYRDIINHPSIAEHKEVSVRGRSTSSDVSSNISPSPLYIPPHHRQPKTECTCGSDTGVR